MIRAVAPLLIRGFGPGAVPTRPSRHGGREQIIPGSALHGAVRSLHETLTGSCLRVLDTEYVPGYRQPADVHQIRQLRLGLVTVVPAAQDGWSLRPPTVRLCDWGDPEDDRIPQETLHRLHSATPGGLRSGTRLDLGPEGSWTVNHQHGAWVVFISDAGTRGKRVEGQVIGQKPYRAQVRQLTDQTATVPDEVWAAFLHAVAGADDLRPARIDQVGGERQRWQEVRFRHEPAGRPASEHQTYTVGLRSLARRTVEPGQPLWLRMDGDGQILEVRLAQIWRMSGTHSVAERAGAFVPCGDDPVLELCPSCRLFGSADVTGSTSGTGQQHSYRGHVRFSDAVAKEHAELVPVILPTQGQPRPGAGQFYLLNPAEAIGNAAKPVPLRQWGSAADPEGRPRRLRGRKYYWHTPPTGGELPARGGTRAPEPPAGDEPAENAAVLYPAGTQFTTCLRFVDIDREQLGSLLAALQPSDLLGQADALVHIGGGQPLGYGSCDITVDANGSVVWQSAHRYTGGPSRPFTEVAAECLDAFRTQCAGLGDTWQALAAVLSPATVAGQRVCYPPGGAETEEGFPFWTQTAGYELATPAGETGRWGHPLTVLPAPTDPGQAMPVIRDATKQCLPNQEPIRS